MKIALITACHVQPTEKWLKALPDIPVIIVDDSDGKIKIDRENTEVFDYKRQEEELGEHYQYFADTFHKSSSCKNFGLWYAYKQGYDYVIMIDSDCNCSQNFVKDHLRAIEKRGIGWENNIREFGEMDFARGFPYSERDKEIVLNMGMWKGQMDINGQDKIDDPELAKIHDYMWYQVGRNQVANGMIPLSGMNLIISRNAIPAYFLIPNFDYEDLKFRRCDDIFGGYIFQKLAKLKGDVISYGQPLIYHDSPVVPEEDAEEEKAMNEYDKEFYRLVDRAIEDVVISGYKEMFCEFSFFSIGGLIRNTKFESLIKSFKWWSNLYV